MGGGFSDDNQPGREKRKADGVCGGYRAKPFRGIINSKE